MTPRRVSVALAAGWALVVLLCAGPAAAQAVARSHPVGVKFDGELHASRMHVRFASELFEQDFKPWSARRQDGAGAAFVALIRSVQRRDVPAARAVLDLAATRASVERLVSELGEMGGEFARMEVVARARVEGDEVFFWRTPRPDGWATGAFAFRQVNGAWKGRLVTSQMPALSLMTDAYDYYGREKSAFMPRAVSGNGYAVPLAADGSVLLEFDGTPVDFAPLEGGSPVSEATALYQQGVMMLAAVDWVGFASLHTAVSKAKIEGWLANEGRDPRAREVGAALLARGVRVVFEVDLGPAGAMLLVAQGEGADPGGYPVKRVMVANTASGPRLTNHFMTYQLGLTLMRSPLWPKEAGPLLALLARSKR
ncbi:MAG: hypothetical protein H6703_08495 [Myxococcales bacterium]|nr:hypothetical protein [Myxococcales bacterium]